MQSIITYPFFIGRLPHGTGIIAHQQGKSKRGGETRRVMRYASPSSRAAVATIRHSPSPSAVGRATARAVHLALPVSL